KVVAADIHSKRLHLLDKNMELFDVSNLDMEEMDGTRPPDKWGEAFDKVLVDAPCTGLGVLSKRADMRWHREESDLKDLIQLQIRLLDGAAACVKPGGLLVYSTCTTEREENMGQVEAFLERHADFRLEPAPDIIPAGLRDAQGNYESRPYESDMDGAFAARLRKN
ncbi:MAG: 16S rRNA (cytosine(967)-C(5))-methyltransferase RsmB, partial [Bacteroidetes Order II. Incertae sedis bacterium]|nr:16S rRNA (cytosine(967)-C(5))-methyltransferase RsmB [Bacteroidetes Order II. bacterium]